MDQLVFEYSSLVDLIVQVSTSLLDIPLHITELFTIHQIITDYLNSFYPIVDGPRTDPYSTNLHVLLDQFSVILFMIF